ncbi:GNAT family N-acetyltransferase [Secundilactobacillus kimchicus]|uniref:Acetyltransferase n=1 Tax=Secundilactobacillus kimchicus JCM 15530 TaxID=1302272 RepID=A0A0R1HQJ2_9LACO|nr:GNAT family N-acetyltransferase [Secundilactobacillus kimchicus]KRK48912.1 acetyltransferase [Secundilactobacillus kimchicus JCM 15530]MBT9671893.1 GNAT family N-acetyltransferase [Secundilactobacillus kimchicus]
MYLRRAEMRDLPQIETIIQDGKELLRAQNIDQWQGNYPDTKVLVDDIQNGHTMVLVDHNEVLGTAAVIPAPDKSYTGIDGEWLTKDDHYVSIHRVAVSAKHRGQGLSGKLFDAMFAEIDKAATVDGIRIDTHPQNKGMQHVIKKMGFTETGHVQVMTDGENVTDFAYEKYNHQQVPAHVE